MNKATIALIVALSGTGVAGLVLSAVFLIYRYVKTPGNPKNHLSNYVRDLTFSGTELGAVFYCHKNPSATKRVLSKFRQFYPRGDVALLADGGTQFSHLVEPFDIKYYEYSENLSVKWTDPSAALKWFDRINRGIQFTKNRWIVILEDDVEFLGRVRERPQAHAWGGKPHILKLSIHLSKVIRKRRISMGIPDKTTVTHRVGLNYGYACCGGTIIDGDFWRKNYDSEQVGKFLSDMINCRPEPYSPRKIIHSDVAMSALILWWGGSILPSQEWTETKFFKVGKPAVMHDFKQEYDKDIKKRPHTLK